MSVRLAKASYKPGEKIFGFVTVTNMNATSVVLPVGHKSATLDFLLILTDEQGKPVSPSKFAKDLNEFGGVLDKTIFAGTSYTVTIPVGICFQLDAPGVYLFHVAHQYEVNDPRASGKLVSNTVKFEIVPAEAKKPAPDK